MSEEAKPARVPAALVMTTPEHLVAFGFGAGLAPVAPGTFGTLVALPLWFLMCWLPPDFYLAITLLLFVFGCWVCGRSAKLLGVHDYGGIVFDEIVGFLVAALPLLSSFGLRDGHLAGWLVAAFVLFRIFDVLKPWPIGVLDRRVRGGSGIMLDDLIAGFYSAALLWLALVLSHPFLH